MPKRKEDRDEDLLAMAKRQSTKFCPHCGRRIHFYAFEKKDRQCCDWCGKYVFKDKKSEYDYRVRELLNRKRREDGDSRNIKQSI